MTTATLPSSAKPSSETPAKAASGKPRFGKGQPAHYCGKKGASGAPKTNGNAIRHGLKAGQLPRDCKYIEYRLNAFRRMLEAAVLEARGAVTINDAALIQTCLRWERHAALAQRWLVKAGDTLKPADKLTFSREIGRASAERDKALLNLKIDRDTNDNVLDALYARLPAPTADSNGDNHEPA